MTTRTLLLIPAFALLLASCTANVSDQAAQTSSDDHSMHVESSSSSSNLALDRLKNSSRHQEWVEVKNGEKTILTWVVYPEVDEPRPVVILIHENKGLNDWARSMADQVAEAGYVAVAPDLLSDFSDTHKRTSDFASDDEATKAISQLKPENVTADLQVVADWAKTLPGSNGTLASAGFCWGGAKSFEFATKRDDLALAMVFYGTGPTDASAYQSIKAPVAGFYGGNDARVNGTIEQSAKNMTDAGKTYDYKIYEGAGHAFMRLGEDPAGDPANVAARTAAWERMKELLSGL